MKVVNLGDQYTKRLTLRLTDIQYKHVCNMAGELDTTPSDYIRYLIMESAIRYDKALVLGVQEGQSDENCKTCSNDNL